MVLPCNSASVFGLGDANELVEYSCVFRRSAVPRVCRGIYDTQRFVNCLVPQNRNTPLSQAIYAIMPLVFLSVPVQASEAIRRKQLYHDPSEIFWTVAKPSYLPRSS
jgi:hypothetical protein